MENKGQGDVNRYVRLCKTTVVMPVVRCFGMLEVCAPAMRSMEDVSKRWVFKMGIPSVSAISSWDSPYFARKVQGYFP